MSNFALSGPIFKIQKLQAIISLSKCLKQSATVGHVVVFLFHTAEEYLTLMMGGW